MAFIIPEGHWAVREYYGKFEEILEPGFYGYIPFIYSTKPLDTWGRIANKSGYLIEKSEQQTNTPTRHCQTKDNVTVNANTSIGWKIIDPKKAVYAIDNLPAALSDIALNTLRANIGTLTFEEVFSSRNILNEKIRGELAGTIHKWGIELLRVEIQELTYSKDVEKAMMKQMIAERECKAVIAIAEGESQAALMRASAESETQVIDAKANANALTITTEAEARALVVAAKAQADALALKGYAETEYLRTLKQEIDEDQAAEILREEKNRESLIKISANPSDKVYIPQGMPLHIQI